MTVGGLLISMSSPTNQLTLKASHVHCMLMCGTKLSAWCRFYMTYDFKSPSNKVLAFTLTGPLSVREHSLNGGRLKSCQLWRRKGMRQTGWVSWARHTHRGSPQTAGVFGSALAPRCSGGSWAATASVTPVRPASVERGAARPG